MLKVELKSFRSIKTEVCLFIDTAITILIGANDVGKSNLLHALLGLNSETNYSDADHNWDTGDQDLSVDYQFRLTQPELVALQGLAAESTSNSEVVGQAKSAAAHDSTNTDIIDVSASTLPKPHFTMPDTIWLCREKGSDLPTTTLITQIYLEPIQRRGSAQNF